ncbi:MAG: hypothetical protein H7Z74_16285 [Anaerolineae bacterium]|nr:hypothetical protein [Gemmatimonadaceae bacterium]
MRLIVAIVALGTVVIACASNQPLVHYYSPQGALTVFNGARMQRSRSGIDSIYQGRWQVPPLVSSGATPGNREKSWANF